MSKSDKPKKPESVNKKLKVAENEVPKGIEGAVDIVPPVEVEETPQPTVYVFKYRSFGNGLKYIPEVCRSIGAEFVENMRDNIVTIKVPAGVELPHEIARYPHQILNVENDLTRFTVQQLQRIAKRAGIGMVGRERKGDLISAILHATASQEPAGDPPAEPESTPEPATAEAAITEAAPDSEETASDAVGYEPVVSTEPIDEADHEQPAEEVTEDAPEESAD